MGEKNFQKSADSKSILVELLQHYLSCSLITPRHNTEVLILSLRFLSCSLITPRHHNEILILSQRFLSCSLITLRHHNEVLILSPHFFRVLSSQRDTILRFTVLIIEDTATSSLCNTIRAKYIGWPPGRTHIKSAQFVSCSVSNVQRATDTECISSPCKNG